MKIFWTGSLTLMLAASALAQNLLLKDGRVVVTKGVRRSGDIIMATVDLPSPPVAAGQAAPPARTGELGYPVAQIAKIDFPEPAQLKVAAGLINTGKAAEALTQLQPLLSYYGGIRDVPGSWWPDAVMLEAQALTSLGRHEELDQLAAQMARVATDPEVLGAARVYGAASLARRGENAKAIQICEGVLNQASRPQTLATAAVIKGESHLARREWDQALLSLLQVPVFYPTEEVLMPRALLGAARAYIGLEDFSRAKQSLADLNAKFAATPEATQGKMEMERITQLEKRPAPAQ